MELDPREFARIQQEAAQEAREAAFDAVRSSSGVEHQRSRADEFSDGWDERESFLASNWVVTSDSPLPGEGRPRKRMR